MPLLKSRVFTLVMHIACKVKFGGSGMGRKFLTHLRASVLQAPNTRGNIEPQHKNLMSAKDPGFHLHVRRRLSFPTRGTCI
jgi:hypothetical protein